MRVPAGAARLLWPSTPAEARAEQERIGTAGIWTGPIGTPWRDGTTPLDPAAHLALKIEPPVPAAIRLTEPAPGLTRALGSGGAIITGARGPLLDWLTSLRAEADTEGAKATNEAGGAGESGPAAAVIGEAVSAVRAGAGLEPVAWQVRTGPVGDGSRTLLMAVINTTPDSFWEGSRVPTAAGIEDALAAAVEGGADLIDIGGESTRPGAEPLPAGAELERVLPAVERAVRDTSLPVSIDTRKEEVARAALEAGAAVINDISGGTDADGMLALAAGYGAGLVLMHRRGESATMQADPRYDDLMGEIAFFLAGQARRAREAGVAREKIAIDPGLGFGKRRAHNFELYRRMAELHSFGYPLLVGPSRKRHLSGPADRGPEDRLPGTLAACALLAREGVQVIRVHDVRAARLALDTADEMRRALIEDRIS